MLEEQIGKYSLVSKIADGGMAEVFLAETGGVGGFAKRVALKKILPYFTSDDAFVHSFINEARICGQLNHQNLVEVYGFDRNDDVYYLAMEYIDGLDLERILAHRRLRKEPLPIAAACALILQVLDGLDYAHRAHSLDGDPLKIIHRDMKPSNVLIDRSGVIKIVDFGIAKASSNVYKTRDLGTAKGTVGYMSPEQATGAADLSPASDLFSVGIIFYELLTLRRLFDGKNVFAILESVRTADVQSQLNELKALPPGLLRVLKRSLSKDLKVRYPSAQAMIRELKAVSPAGRGHDLLSKFIEQLTKQGLSPLHTSNPEQAGRPGMGANAPGEEIQLRTRILDAKALEQESIRLAAEQAGLGQQSPPEDESERTRPLPPKALAEMAEATFSEHHDDYGEEGPDTIRHYELPEGAVPPSMQKSAMTAPAPHWQNESTGAASNYDDDEPALRTMPGGQAPPVAEQFNRPRIVSNTDASQGRSAPPDLEDAETTAGFTPVTTDTSVPSFGLSQGNQSHSETTGKTTPGQAKTINRRLILALSVAALALIGVAAAFFLKPVTTDVYINIESDPTGAEVYVDSELALRSTPGQIVLTLSKARNVGLTLEKEGYESFTQSGITVSPHDFNPQNPLTFHFTLKPKVPLGSLYVATSPPGAQVWLDGKPTQYYTPITIPEIAVGQHKLTLKRPGHQDSEFQLDIIEGEQNIERALTPIR